MFTFSKSEARRFLTQYARETSAAGAYVLLLALMAVAAPDFFSLANLRDLTLANVPVLVTAIGMTLIILLGHIDISVGAQFAVCSVVAGLLAKSELPMILVALMVPLCGGILGSLNGALAAGLSIPSIVVTLAAMAGLRDALRWATEGAWVQNLPPGFQWLGLGQSVGQLGVVAIALLIFAAFAWGMRSLEAGRAIYATGSDVEAARLAGLQPRWVFFNAFVLMGVLTGAAAFLNSIRFMDIQSNAGIGLELKSIAAVVVGGTSIQGGRGTLWGTLAGVALLGTIGTALTFLGINPFWEKAIQGGIILAAVVSDYLVARVGNAEELHA
jgi:rhamnose transport system permease protein